MTQRSALLAEGLLEREPAVLREYRARLERVGSPLVSEPTLWHEVSRQAAGIVAECARTLRCGTAQPESPDLGAVVEMAARRGVKGIHPRHSVRASMLLFEVVLDEVRALVAQDGGDCSVVGEVALTLNRAVSVRLEAGAVGYDSFLLNQVREVIDGDRKGLAREIHDRVGNSVSLAMRNLELAVPDTRSPVPVDICEQIRNAQKALAEVLRELRGLIGGLRRSRAEGALKSALEAFVCSSRRQQPDVTIAVNGVESWAPVEAVDEVFLILRESLRNVFAHARARHVTVKVDVAPHELRATVEDDGSGFDVDAVARRDTHGLHSMAERARSLVGDLDVTSSVGYGTRVELWIPLATS